MSLILQVNNGFSQDRSFVSHQTKRPTFLIFPGAIHEALFDCSVMPTDLISKSGKFWRFPAVPGAIACFS